MVDISVLVGLRGERSEGEDAMEVKLMVFLTIERSRSRLLSWIGSSDYMVSAT